MNLILLGAMNPDEHSQKCKPSRHAKLNTKKYLKEHKYYWNPSM